VAAPDGDRFDVNDATALPSIGLLGTEHGETVDGSESLGLCRDIEGHPRGLFGGNGCLQRLGIGLQQVKRHEVTLIEAPSL
jgi:hypothetical protein